MLNLACKLLQAFLGRIIYTEAAGSGDISERFLNRSSQYASRMGFVIQDSQGDQENYIQYLKALVYEFAKHHSHDHENCQFVPSARLPTNQIAPVATRSEALLDTSKRPRKRGFHDEGESKEEFKFLSWQPSNRPTKPRDNGTKSWMPLAKKLVHLIPLAADWWKDAESFNLEIIMQGGMAAQFVLDGSTKNPSIPRRRQMHGHQGRKGGENQ